MISPKEYFPINEYFDRIYVIAFKNDVEHRNLIKDYFDKFKINFEFFDAVDGFDNKEIAIFYEDYLTWSYDDIRTHHIEKVYKKKLIKSQGALGLLATYKKLFESIIEDQSINNVLILEDDVLFDQNIHEKFACVHNCIDRYDLLYLGASHHIWRNQEVTNIQDGISYYKAPKVLDGSFAVAYNRNIFQELLTKINKQNAPIDLILRDITEKGNSYVIYPNIAIAETTRPSKTSLVSRNLRNHAKNLKWDLSNIDYTRGILKVSIIVASCNNKHTIKNCIDSALNQTYKNIELIVVDDCSTDGSIEILESYQDKIKLIKLTENVGAYKVRNIGLENSTGFFVSLLDADDIMMSKKIELDVHNYYNNSYCDIFFSNIYRSQNIQNIDNIDDSVLQRHIDNERGPYLNPDIKNYLWGHNAPWKYRYRMGMSTIFVEKNFFDMYGKWRDDFRYGMDIELIQRYIINKYNVFVDHQTLFKELCKYNGEHKYGIFLSKTMNYFSYPMNSQNATNICRGIEREKIHEQTNYDLINTLKQQLEKQNVS
jgi:glycosyltransferase involved in cell wall biosynthesis